MNCVVYIVHTVYAYLVSVVFLTHLRIYNGYTEKRLSLLTKNMAVIMDSFYGGNSTRDYE